MRFIAASVRVFLQGSQVHFYMMPIQNVSCKITHMETLADRVRARLLEVGKTANAASIEAGGSPSLIPNILNGRSASPRGQTLSKLATVLGVTEQWLLTGDEPPAAPAVLPRTSEVRPAPVPVPFGDPKDLPVLGTAAGGELGNGSFQMTTDVIDWVRRPAGLSGAKDAYALYVEGDSMSPRFEPGDLVFIHPHRKPLSGDYVVIQEPDSNNGEPRAFIKKLVKVTGTTLMVTQFNPPATINFILRPGLIWHKVMTDGDLYGV